MRHTGSSRRLLPRAAASVPHPARNSGQSRRGRDWQGVRVPGQLGHEKMRVCRRQWRKARVVSWFPAPANSTRGHCRQWSMLSEGGRADFCDKVRLWPSPPTLQEEGQEGMCPHRKATGLLEQIPTAQPQTGLLATGCHCLPPCRYWLMWEDGHMQGHLPLGLLITYVTGGPQE